jgi:hypothetical protein
MGQADRPHESDCRFSQEQYDMLKRCSDKREEETKLTLLIEAVFRVAL